MEAKSPQELLRLYCETLSELRRRGLTRSTKNPVADISEMLMANTLKLELLRGSTTGYDATDSSGKRYEIKGRRITPQNKSRQMSFIRGLDMEHFDFLVGVLFDENFDVMRGCIIPRETVKRLAQFVSHVNGWRIHLRDRIWNEPGIRDITQELQLAMKAM